MERLQVLDKDDFVGMRFVAVPCKLELDVRFLRKKKYKPKFKKLSWSEIKSVSKSSIVDPNDNVVSIVAITNFKNAFIFERKSQFVDAYLAIHLAIELMLKSMLVKMKYSYRIRFQDDLPKNVIGGSVIDSPQFSHDLNLILNYLLSICSEISKTPNARKFIIRIKTAQGMGRWADLRYTVNQKNNLENLSYQQKYLELKNDTLPFLAYLFREGLFR